MKRLDAYLDEIQIALECDAVYPALAMALTLPDICSTLGFASYERPTTATTYRTWCRKFLERRVHTNPDNLYALRCCFLHNATGRPTKRHKQRRILEEYKLTRDAGHIAFRIQKRTSGKEIVGEVISVSAHVLCGDFLAGVRKWQKAKGASRTTIRNLKTLLVIG